MGVTRLAIRRPIAILMLVLAFVVLGLISYQRLPSELNPKVDFGVITVQTTYPGTNPQEMETLITKPIEDSISGVSGLKQISSTSQQGVSTVSCQFFIGTDLNVSAADVRQKVDAVRQKLPTEANSPVVSKRDTSSQPVMYIAMHGGDSSRQLRVLADNVVSESLQQAPDVAAVDVFGGDVREIRIAVNRDRLTAYGITISQLANAIHQANTNIAAGYIQTDSVYESIRFLGEFASVDEIRKLWIPLPTAATTSTATGSSGTSSSTSSARWIRLADIADIKDTTTDRTQFSTIDGQQTVTLAIEKTSDGNTLNACNGVKKQLADVQKFLPSNVTFTTTTDTSQQVKDNLKDVVVSLCLGALLAILIVYLFLHNFRATVIVAIAIPTCVISTFLPISLFGFTLNTMTLLGLSLAIGILIDDSIVVLENIVRHLQLGEDPVTAAIKGRTEIGLAAVTLTAVDLVVFIPIAFMGGIVGEFFRSFGASVAVAVSCSLFVSFTLTPMLASRWFHKGEAFETDGVGKRGFAAAFDRGYHLFQKRYTNMLRWCLDHAWTVAIIGNSALVLTILFIASGGTGLAMMPVAAKLATGVIIIGLVVAFWGPISRLLGLVWRPVAIFGRRLFKLPRPADTTRPPVRIFNLEPMIVACIVAAAVVATVFAGGTLGHPLGIRFAPGQDQNQVAVTVEAPAGSSIKYTEAITRQVEQRIRKTPEISKNVKYLLTSIGQSNSTGQGNVGTQYANIMVSLNDKAAPLDAMHGYKGEDGVLLRRVTDADVAALIRKATATIPGAKIQSSEVNGFGGGGAPLQIQITGVNFTDLLKAANEVKTYISKVPGVYNTDLSFKASQPELQIRLDRERAAAYGLNLQDIAGTVAAATQGDIGTKFRDPSDNEQYDMRVQLADVEKNNQYSISQIPVGYSGGSQIVLGQVAQITVGAGPTRVDRLNRLREVTVTGYLLPGYQIGNINQKANPGLKKLFAQPQFSTMSYTWGGEAQSIGDEGPFLMQAVLLGIILSYMLMAALFNNLLYPLAIMLTLPQALVGALLALFITNQPFSLIAAIGVILLNGLAAKNGILMVDYTNTLRSRGYKRVDALLEAAPTRLRPILMTSSAIIGATLPTALALGRGAGFRQSLGIVVVGGVIVSTILTLIVIPSVYLLFDNLSNFTRRIARSRRSDTPDFGESALVTEGAGEIGVTGNGVDHAGGTSPAARPPDREKKPVD